VSTTFEVNVVVVVVVVDVVKSESDEEDKSRLALMRKLANSPKLNRSWVRGETSFSSERNVKFVFDVYISLTQYFD
jgi:hypothetical protein